MAKERVGRVAADDARGRAASGRRRRVSVLTERAERAIVDWRCDVKMNKDIYTNIWGAGVCHRTKDRPYESGNCVKRRI